MAVKARQALSGACLFLVSRLHVGCQIRSTGISAYNQRMRDSPASPLYFSAIPSPRRWPHFCHKVFLPRRLRRTAPATGDAERASILPRADIAPKRSLCSNGHPPNNGQNFKKSIGLDGLHCAMTHGVPYESLEFLVVLSHDSHTIRRCCMPQRMPTQTCRCGLRKIWPGMRHSPIRFTS